MIMGLFGSKKTEEATARITDFFFTEDLLKIKELVGQKKDAHMYKLQYIDVVDCLLDAINNTEKSLDKNEVRKILFSVGTMTKIEPTLNPIFNPAIEKMRAFRK